MGAAARACRRSARGAAPRPPPRRAGRQRRCLVDAGISFYDSTVEEYAARVPQRLSMRRSSAGGCVLDVPHTGPGEVVALARFVRDEILMRLASTLRSFQVLPLAITGNHWLHRVFRVSWDHFQQIRRLEPPTDHASEQRFAGLLFALANVQASLLGTVSKGFREVRVWLDEKPPAEQQRFLWHINAFLDAYMAQRISRRVLARHYLTLRRHRQGGDESGVFDPRCSPAEVVRSTADMVSGLCSEEFGIAAPVEMAGDVDTSLLYIGGHLSYVVRELLKNAMRATVERAGGFDAEEVPAVRVTVTAAPAGDVWISIADQGGGMAPAKLARAFGYGVTDFRQHHRPGVRPGPLDSAEDGWLEIDADARRLAGHGFGLPLARIFLRYFGGELTVRSQEEHGTQAYIRLRQLTNWREDLSQVMPIRDELARGAAGPLPAGDAAHSRVDVPDLLQWLREAQLDAARLRRENARLRAALSA
eukprot:TRINITY_DN29662_c0_g1_i1.p1 TRINITY_DN29662_c0_g1~~TRINITY_DN29662_c0_g1_i1.p1  ORF type:complete len:511 (+),score=184.55 TRINITY_DN29662_c0_g1_i1:107-1534(+)